MPSAARTADACNNSVRNDIFALALAAREERRPHLLTSATLASALDGQPPEGTSGCGEAEIIPELRMVGNGGLVSPGQDWFAAIAFLAVCLAIVFGTELPA